MNKETMQTILKEKMQNALQTLQSLSLRRIKMVPFILTLGGSLMMLNIIFMFLFMQGRQPNFNLLLSFSSSGIPEYQYSIFGSVEQMLVKPMGITVSGNRLYVTDTMNYRVQVLALNGEQLFSFGSHGSNPGEFQFPYGIAVASNGEIFVADSYNGYISVFDKRGSFLRYCGARTPELTNPAGLLLHGGKLYVTNLDPGYILILDPSTGEHLRTFGKAGQGEAELSFPNAITAGPDGNLYVSDTANHRIVVFDTAGDFIRIFSDDSEAVDSPRMLAFDNYGRLLVVNKMYNDIVALNNNGVVVGRFGGKILNLPNGLAVDGKGGVYVTDHVSVALFR